MGHSCFIGNNEEYVMWLVGVFLVCYIERQSEGRVCCSSVVKRVEAILEVTIAMARSRLCCNFERRRFRRNVFLVPTGATKKLTKPVCVCMCVNVSEDEIVYVSLIGILKWLIVSNVKLEFLNVGCFSEDETIGTGIFISV